jgi:DHA3 family tetracycline resistance protein-like MFS transporter
VLTILANWLIGFGLGTFGIIWVTLMQELVPAEMLGRVSSIDQLGAWSLLPLGYVLTGLATDRFGPSLVFLIAGLFNILLAVIALAVPAIRRVV